MITVMITTYNRPECVYQLTKRLKDLRPDVRIVVIDDHSDSDIDATYIDHLINNSYNHGKKEYYKTLNTLWKAALSVKSDYYIMLVDDAYPRANFFDCIKRFMAIRDNRKVALHLANNGRKRNWTKFNRIDFNQYVYKTQTTEMSFLCTPDFISYRLPRVDPKRWGKNPLLGSGVGGALNNHWVKKGHNIYGMKLSLIVANDNCSESIMNPEARKTHPWKLM